MLLFITINVIIYNQLWGDACVGRGSESRAAMHAAMPCTTRRRPEKCRLPDQVRRSLLSSPHPRDIPQRLTDSDF